MTAVSVDPPGWWSSPDKGCADVDPEVFFPPRHAKRAYEAAQAVCRECPYQAECAEYAENIPWGVWGATTPEERGFDDRRRVTRRTQGPGAAATRGVAPNRPVIDRAVLFAAAARVVAGEESVDAARRRIGVGATVFRSAVRVCRRAPHLVDAVVAGRVTLYAAEQAARLS